MIAVAALWTRTLLYSSSTPWRRTLIKSITTTAAAAAMAPKRKATSPVRPSTSPKKTRPDSKQPDDDDSSGGVVDRAFYPPVLSHERCAEYINGERPRPIELLETAIRTTAEARAQIAAGDAVVHWFKRDLRTFDNKALHLASETARKHGVPLVGVFIISPQDYAAHITSPRRVDFELRTLEVLKADLAAKKIPLYVRTIESRRHVPRHLLEKCKEWGAKHVFCNIEYEVDELRREARLVKDALDEGIDFTPVHDDVVVPPGTLQTGKGGQFSVYTPWLRAWISYLHSHPAMLDLFDPPTDNPPSAEQRFKSIFAADVPSAPPNKAISDKERDHLTHLFPAGEHEARSRLERFLQEKVKAYKDTRNLPAENSTSLLSVHFSAGTLSARSAVRAARDINSAQKLDGGNAGIACWISELAWRDFYKHVLAHWPFVCMNKPFKYEYTDIEWDHSPENFAAWCEGRTGFPIVDAAMRQLGSMGYMHNRCRMIVACFLAKDLLLDWRLGEQFFMSQLIDGDFASNNGGWGFSASTGVDPQPYFRIFNPTLQSEKFDAEGEYIRKWVPELRDVRGNAIHDPYSRGAESVAKKAGYPRPIVDHKEARQKALDRYKSGLGRSTANVGGGVHN